MDTSSVVILLLLALILVPFLAAVLRRRGHFAARGSGPWPFYAKRLLTPPEQVLYHRLVKSLPNHIVLAQVQVSRVLGVKKGFRFHEWNNRISRMSYDFVICDKSSAVIAAIELDDKSHESAHRIEANTKKSKATTDAGLRLVRWHVRSLPDELTIQREFCASDALPEGLHAEARPNFRSSGP